MESIYKNIIYRTFYLSFNYRHLHFVCYINLTWNHSHFLIAINVIDSVCNYEDSNVVPFLYCLTTD